MRLLKSIPGRFVLLGVVLFCLDRGFFPDPKPVIGPPNEERVRLQVEALAQLKRTQLNDSQIEEIKRREIRDEVLFVEALNRGLIQQDQVVQRRLIRNMRFMDPERDAEDDTLLAEALELRLHLADEVVRRRTIQVMESLIVAAQGDILISDDDLMATYQLQRDKYAEPTRYDFHHVFLRDDVSEERRDRLLAMLADSVLPREARTASDVFLAGYQFRGRSALDISRQFGDSFAESFVAEVEVLESWVGPIGSVFGNHWIWVDDISESRIKGFSEVAQELRRDRRREMDEEAIQAWVAAALERYEVRL